MWLLEHSEQYMQHSFLLVRDSAGAIVNRIGPNDIQLRASNVAFKWIQGGSEGNGLCAHPYFT